MALSAEAKVPKGSILPDEFRPFSTISSPCARGPVWDPGKPLSCLRSPLTARKVPLRLRLLRLLMLVHETAFGLQVPLVMALRLRGGARDGGLELLGGRFGADDRQLTGDHRLLRRIGPGDCRKVSGHARQGPEHRVTVPALVAAVSGAGGQFRVQSGPLVGGEVFGQSVSSDVVAVHGRVQRALIGDAHLRKDSFHSPPSAGEDRVDESVVVGSFPVGDRTGGTAIDGE